MSAIDVDATMAPMNYEVMTDNEPIVEKNKNKINLGPTFIWHILAINLGPMHKYAAGSSTSSNMKMTQPCRLKHFCFTICYFLQFFWSSKTRSLIMFIGSKIFYTEECFNSRNIVFDYSYSPLIFWSKNVAFEH